MQRTKYQGVRGKRGSSGDLAVLSVTDEYNSLPLTAVHLSWFVQGNSQTCKVYLLDLPLPSNIIK